MPSRMARAVCWMRCADALTWAMASSPPPAQDAQYGIHLVECRQECHAGFEVLDSGDKKAMRLVDTRTVEGDVVILTYERVQDASRRPGSEETLDVLEACRAKMIAAEQHLLSRFDHGGPCHGGPLPPRRPQT
jgi:hypothetical protein